MLLRRLVLEDFGLYRGVQEIDLTPRQRRGRTLPVVLFGGKKRRGQIDDLRSNSLVPLWSRRHW